MLPLVHTEDKPDIKDLVNNLLKELEENPPVDRLGAATHLHKQIFSLGIMVDAWRMWIADVVSVSVLTLEDLEKMLKDFTSILEIITPPSGYFSKLLEEKSKKILNKNNKSAGEIIVV